MQGAQANILFRVGPRVKMEPRRYDEPAYDFLDSSGQPAAARIRVLVERWFSAMPDNVKNDLRIRFRSSEDAEHLSAFFEIYIFSLLRSGGFDVCCHPRLPRDAGRHPDFLVSRGGKRLFYLEATTSGISHRDEAINRRKEQLLAAINELAARDFILLVDEVDGFPTETPSVTRVKAELQKWLDGLDFREARERYERCGIEGTPCFPFCHSGWELHIRAIPRASGLRGKDLKQAVGAHCSSLEWLDDRSGIRSSLRAKVTRYGEPDLPYVIALDVLRETADAEDVFDALFGSPVHWVARVGSSHFRVKEAWRPDGLLYGPQGPRCTRLSAVLVAHNLTPWTAGVVSVVEISNPWASKPLPEGVLGLRGYVPNVENGRIEEKAGTPAWQILGLPHGWPLEA